MTLSPGLRRLTLTIHLTSSVGWLGAVAAFLVLAVAAVTSSHPPIVRAGCLAMLLSVTFVIVPLAFASFASGLISALGTKWGLVRHYWVFVKFVMILVATCVLLVQLASIGRLADAAAKSTTSMVALQTAAKRPLVHAIGGLLVLLVTQVLGVYKPWGKTQYGWRAG